MQALIGFLNLFAVPGHRPNEKIWVRALTFILTSLSGVFSINLPSPLCYCVIDVDLPQ